MMQVVAVENADAVKVYAASRIVRGVESGRIKVLGVATGDVTNSPISNAEDPQDSSIAV